MKKILIVLLIILAVATGAYFIFKKKPCTDCANKEKEEESEPVNTGAGNTERTHTKQYDRSKITEDTRAEELAPRLDAQLAPRLA